MIIYIFGPIEGVLNYKSRFDTAKARLCDMGHDAHSPLEITGELPENSSIREVMKADLSWICDNAEGLVGLSGWSLSRGSLAEVHLAWRLAIPVYEYDSFIRRVIREIKSIPHLGG